MMSYSKLSPHSCKPHTFYNFVPAVGTAENLRPDDVETGAVTCVLILATCMC